MPRVPPNRQKEPTMDPLKTTVLLAGHIYSTRKNRDMTTIVIEVTTESLTGLDLSHPVLITQPEYLIEKSKEYDREFDQQHGKAPF